jgi:sec-independent protein translocase protein TatA
MNVMLAGMFGAWEIILVIAVILLLFGGAKIPQLMGGLGKGIKEFKKSSREEEDESKPK